MATVPQHRINQQPVADGTASIPIFVHDPATAPASAPSAAAASPLSESAVLSVGAFARKVARPVAPVAHLLQKTMNY
jgi:hypothetical protein